MHRLIRKVKHQAGSTAELKHIWILACEEVWGRIKNQHSPSAYPGIPFPSQKNVPLWFLISTCAVWKKAMKEMHRGREVLWLETEWWQVKWQRINDHFGEDCHTKRNDSSSPLSAVSLIQFVCTCGHVWPSWWLLTSPTICCWLSEVSFSQQTYRCKLPVERASPDF